MFPSLTTAQWGMAILAAFGVGMSKAGLPGISLFHVVVMAHLFPGAASTGVVLPMLVCGDIAAVIAFRRDARWSYLWRTLPPAMVGVVVGWWIMQRMKSQHFGPAIGGLVLALAALQMARQRRPAAFAVIPHSRMFGLTMGFIAGITTMIANAAGPVMGLYLLAVSLPKKEFVGTSAWFFLAINVFKLPFSVQLGLITSKTLIFNATLVPLILFGLFCGHQVVTRVPQRWFDTLILGFAVIAAIKLMGLF